VTNISFLSLSDDQEAAQPLLKQFATILVSGLIDNDTYVEFSWALRLGRVLHPTQPLIVQFNGLGGDVTPALGMADLIQADGNVWGVALGRVCSCLSVLWAACARRYIAPNAALGVHPVVMSIGSEMNAAGMRNLADDTDHMDERAIAIYTAASTKDIDYWRSVYFTATDHLEILPASAVIGDLGMAFPLERLNNDLRRAQIRPNGDWQS